MPRLSGHSSCISQRILLTQSTSLAVPTINVKVISCHFVAWYIFSAFPSLFCKLLLSCSFLFKIYLLYEQAIAFLKSLIVTVCSKTLSLYSYFELIRKLLSFSAKNQNCFKGQVFLLHHTSQIMISTLKSILLTNLTKNISQTTQPM